MMNPEEKPVSADHSLALDDSAMQRGNHIWFALPPGFVEIPFGSLLAEPGSEEARRVIGAVRELLQIVPQEQHEAFLGQLSQAQGLLALLRKDGTVHCSLGAHGDDKGGVLQSVFTLTWRETPWTPRRISAVRAATARESASGIEMLDLPCGPGTIAETVVETPASVDPLQRSLYQATAYLPHPDGKRLAVLALGTTAVEAREHYRDMLRAIAHMVSFDNPLPEELREQIPESEVAASVRAVFG